MGTPRHWSELAGLPLDQLHKLADRSLAKHMQEELLPFSPWLRRVSAELGLGPKQVRRVRDLAELPCSDPSDLAAEASDFRLVPDPRSLREHWPFGRKLALSLAGGRGGELLRRAYGSVATWPLQVAGKPLWLESTARCLELAGEVGARAYSILGLDRPGTRVVLASPLGTPARECWLQGRIPAGVQLYDAGGPKELEAEQCAIQLHELGAQALIAEPPFAQAVLEAAGMRRLTELKVVVLANYAVAAERKGELRELARTAGADAQVCNVFDPPATRLLFPEAPADPDASSGYVLYPDLACVEVLDPETNAPATSGELCFTTCSQRGTALVRYRLGITSLNGIHSGPCPHSGRTLPRLQPGLRRSLLRTAGAAVTRDAAQLDRADEDPGQG